MQSSYFARFIQQISSVSAGAVASWCEYLALLIPGQTLVFIEKSQTVGTACSGFCGTDTQEE